jgi:hypothetical protein
MIDLSLAPPGVSSIRLQRLASVAGFFFRAVARQECLFHQATLLDGVRSGVSSRIYSATSTSNTLVVGVRVPNEEPSETAPAFFLVVW